MKIFPNRPEGIALRSAPGRGALLRIRNERINAVGERYVFYPKFRVQLQTGAQSFDQLCVVGVLIHNSLYFEDWSEWR